MDSDRGESGTGSASELRTHATVPLPASRRHADFCAGLIPNGHDSSAPVLPQLWRCSLGAPQSTSYIGCCERTESVADSEREIAAARARIGMVFQSYNLFPHMNVLQNIVAAPVRVRGIARRQAEARARELLAMVGLSDKVAEYPIRLSGGQQQRVAIARALAMDPKIMLFDEVTSALDPELVGEVLAAIQQLAGDGMTMVVVTHEMSFARDIADRIVFMDAGIIVEEGKPDHLLFAPQSERVRAFLKRYNDRYRI